MLSVSFETVTKVNIIALKRTTNKSFKFLVKFRNVRINVYFKLGKFGLIWISFGQVK